MSSLWFWDERRQEQEFEERLFSPAYLLWQYDLLRKPNDLHVVGECYTHWRRLYWQTG